MIDESDIRSSSRNSLHVRRYHVWPMLQEQRTDAHTLQMLRIYCCVWGPPAPIVAWNIIFHDAGEGDAGDIQFGAKLRSTELKAATDAVEDGHRELLWATDVVPEVLARRSEWDPGSLTPAESWQIKAVDLVEGLEHSLTDVAMGNRLAGPVVAAYSGAHARHCARQVASATLVKPLSDYLARPYHQKLWAVYRDTCG